MNNYNIKIALDQDKKADFALGIKRGYQVTEGDYIKLFLKADVESERVKNQ